MTTESKATLGKAKSRRIKAPEFQLNIYYGEQALFVKVPPADKPEGKSDWWGEVQRFYRIVKANLGLDANDIWDGRYGYAVLPLSATRLLREKFSLHLISTEEFEAVEVE